MVGLVAWNDKFRGELGVSRGVKVGATDAQGVENELGNGFEDDDVIVFLLIVVLLEWSSGLNIM